MWTFYRSPVPIRGPAAESSMAGDLPQGDFLLILGRRISGIFSEDPGKIPYILIADPIRYHEHLQGNIVKQLFCFLDSFFIFISALGKPAAYMIFLSGIYWIFDRKWGARIIILFYFSGWVNSTLKDLIGHPRPYVLDETVKVGPNSLFGIVN